MSGQVPPDAARANLQAGNLDLRRVMNWLPIMPDDPAIPWDQLLTDIHKRQVLPIIGPALVTVDDSPPLRVKSLAPQACLSLTPSSPTSPASTASPPSPA